MYHVYILRSLKDGKYYIGSSSDINSRMLHHNSGKQRSTKNRIPLELVYSEEFSTKSEALKRERQIKSNPIKEELLLVNYWKMFERCFPAIGGVSRYES